MTKYLVKIKHDQGTVNLIITAETEESAKNIAIKAEGCPPGAIQKIINLQFYNKDGSLNGYGLACGYVERKNKGTKTKYLFMEHGHYHIRHGDTAANGPLNWNTYYNLTQARKSFKRIKL